MCVCLQCIDSLLEIKSCRSYVTYISITTFLKIFCGGYNRASGHRCECTLVFFCDIVCQMSCHSIRNLLILILLFLSLSALVVQLWKCIIYVSSSCCFQIDYFLITLTISPLKPYPCYGKFILANMYQYKELKKPLISRDGVLYLMYNCKTPTANKGLSDICQKFFHP